MASFNHGRVLFVGDAAHQVSPFGARGANSGLQDADNLGWKLKLVIDGQAPARLLDSYTEERAFAADENLMNSTRSTDFITPKSRVSRTFRNAVLGLAKDHPSPARWSIRAAFRCRPSSPIRASTRRTRRRVFHRPHAARRADGRRAGAAAAGTAGCSTGSATASWRFFTTMPPRCRRRRSRRWRPVLRRNRRRAAGDFGEGRAAQAGFRCWKTRAASPRSAMTRSPARSTCCAPTSMSRRAGAARCRKIKAPWPAPHAMVKSET
jgi:hypothetical protein